MEAALGQAVLLVLTPAFLLLFWTSLCFSAVLFHSLQDSASPASPASPDLKTAPSLQRCLERDDRMRTEGMFVDGQRESTRACLITRTIHSWNHLSTLSLLGPLITIHWEFPFFTALPFCSSPFLYSLSLAMSDRPIFLVLLPFWHQRWNHTQQCSLITLFSVLMDHFWQNTGDLRLNLAWTWFKVSFPLFYLSSLYLDSHPLLWLPWNGRLWILHPL